MKNLLKLTIFLAVTALTTFAFSAEEVVKWTQMPNLGPFGYAFSSESLKPSRSADDFECIGGEPVVAVRWWGSYYEPVPSAHFYPNSAGWNDPTTASDVPVADMLIGFDIRFYENITAGTDPLTPWAHPGTELYQTVVPIISVSEVFFGTVTHVNGVEQNVWKYYASLPDTGFEQEEGVTYWISIQALHRDETVQWGWQEANQPGWNADMVQNGYNQLFTWDLVANKELAFQLITHEGDIPEPASIFAISVVLLGFFMRKKVK